MGEMLGNMESLNELWGECFVMNCRYEKFRETKQAALKLRIALEEYFREEADTGSPPRETEEETAKERQDYEAYLRRRVRPAAEELMEQNRIEVILQMEEMGLA